MTDTPQNPTSSEPDEEIKTGTVRTIDGEDRIRIRDRDVKHYDFPTEESIHKGLEEKGLEGKHLEKATNQAVFNTKKERIQLMISRFFQNAEGPINVPAAQVDTLRENYQEAKETNDPALIKGSATVLAGALFNRLSDHIKDAASIQKDVVNEDHDSVPQDKLTDGKTPTELKLQKLEQSIGSDLVELLDIGELVSHKNGKDNIREMVGEPVMALQKPLEAFYEHRYGKVADAQNDIDKLSDQLIETIEKNPLYEKTNGKKSLAEKIDNYRDTALKAVETHRNKGEYYEEIVPKLIASRSEIRDHKPNVTLPKHLPQDRQLRQTAEIALSKVVLEEFAGHISDLVEARVDLPEGTKHMEKRIEQLENLHERNRQNGVSTGRG